MKVKDRASLLKFLADSGYEGAKKLDDITKWLASDEATCAINDTKGNALDAKGIGELWAVVATATQEDDEAETPKADPKGTKAKISGVNAKLHGETDSRSPAAFKRIAARKAYDIKANSGRNGSGAIQTAFSDADTAEAFGSWVRSEVLPKSYQHGQREYDNEVLTKANVTYTNSGGGATVPIDFDPQLIDLKERFGIARQMLGTIPMRNDTLIYPRRTAGVTVYAPGEGSAITESNPAFDNVTLVAVKMAAYTTVTSELIHDSALNFGDVVAREMVYAMTAKEDDCWLTGDGTSTDFNVAGLSTKFLALTATRANIAGLYVASDNNMSLMAIGDLTNTMALAPNYVDFEPSVGWICHKRFYYNVMRRLALAAGGTTATEIVNGVPRYIYDGFPVYTTPVMPRDDTVTDTICAYFGAPRLGCKMGEVRGGTTMATSEHVGFASDTIAFRMTQRVAINNHDYGNQSATESLRVPGPIVGLLGKAS